MTRRTIILDLPWPPSVNRYWRHVKGRVLISKEGREYRKTVCSMVRAMRVDGFGNARIAVHVMAHVPDRRRRDLDNLGKALFDALEHAGIYDDDGQIDDQRITRAPQIHGGKVVVAITEIGDRPE